MNLALKSVGGHFKEKAMIIHPAMNSVRGNIHRSCGLLGRVWAAIGLLGTCVAAALFVGIMMLGFMQILEQMYHPGTLNAPPNPQIFLAQSTVR